MTATITCAGCNHAYVATALFCPNCGRAKLRDAGDELVGRVLGERFLVQERLGQGASGTIYRAEHVTLRRKVGIKVLHEELSRDDLAVERFRREATTVADIDNEHIVEIHDFGRTPDGRLYLAMELLEGETLDAILARERQLSIERTADILIQVGEALMEAHAIGYVHRDLRPRNLFLAVRRGKANFVKLLDFGLAKLVESDASAASTSLGMTFGDPRYMSPEQARGDRIDRRADIYQLGCVAYEMLTGAPPFSGNRVFDILTKQVTEAPEPLPTRRPGVPLWMEAAVAKMLAKDPENRFATTTRMVEALRRGLETGEVMEDQIARRRESVPPPSVSRVMQKMGLAPDAEPEVPAVAPAPAPVPVPAPAPAAPPHNQTVRGVPTAKPDPAGAPHDQTVRGVPTAKPDSVELVRRRTGTPQLGVQVSSASLAAAAAEQQPVSGSIDPDRTARQRPARDSSSGRDDREPAFARRDDPPQDARDSAGISQVWYDEGDRASEDAGTSRERARKQISPSTTDLGLYDDELPRRRRGGLIVAALGGLVVIGGVAYALTRGGGASDSAPPAPADPRPAVAVTVDAAPAEIVTPPDAAVAPATPVIASKPVTPRRPSPSERPAPRPRPSPPSRPPPRGRDGSSVDPTAFVPPGSEGPSVGTHRDPPPTGPVIAPPPPPPPAGSGSGAGSSGVTSGPQDPYGGGGSSPAPADTTSAAEYAGRGIRQLATGDTAGAAASFKKALELDPSNATATIGLGEIALRQGLYSDAIAHLSKAARLQPRSSHVFTLLGEAYLRSGNAVAAAAQFQKALQINPDNARARDGYNEASSKVPPPSDDE